MTARVRVGVIGTGVGLAHIAAFRGIPDVEIAAVCSAQAERAAAVAERFSIPLATSDYRDLLRSQVDAVVIATPPALHAPISRAAIAAGKHVLCEKPLATTVAEAIALRDAARRAGIVHMLNHQWRFVPPFARAKQLVDAGYLGELAVADIWCFINPIDYLGAADASTSKAGWYTDAAQGGGLLAAAGGPHMIDLLLWLGGPIGAVTAQTGVSSAMRQSSAEDTFAVVGRFAAGGTATLRGMPIGYRGGAGLGVALHGTRGTLEISTGRLRGATREDRALAEIELGKPAAGGQVALAERFIAAICAGEAAPAPSFDDGVAVQAVLNASLEAANTRQWVSVTAPA